MGISLLSLWIILLLNPWLCSLKTKMFKSKSNLKHFINLLNFFLKNYFFCRKSISPPADGPWLKSIFFYSNGFLFWLRKKIMEHLSVLADIYSTSIHYSRQWYTEDDSDTVRYIIQERIERRDRQIVRLDTKKKRGETVHTEN